MIFHELFIPTIKNKDFENRGGPKTNAKTNSVTQIYSWTGANKPELIHFYFSAFFNFQGGVSSFQRTLLPMAQCENVGIFLTLRFYVKSI